MQGSTQSIPTVLVADDDELICMLIARALQPRGLQVTLAHTAEQSIAACSTSQFDLVIVDAHIPGLDLRACLALLENNNPHSPILVISGDLDRPEWLATETVYLSKPFGLTELLATVAQLLGRSEISLSTEKP